MLGETSFIPLDIHEGPEYFYIEVEIPGISLSDINLYVCDKNLIIEGLKQEQVENEVNFLCMERSFGPFRRIVKIPSAINTYKIKASYDKGILTVTLPKNLERRKKTIRINISGEK